LTSRICIKSHLLSFEYRVKINSDHRTRSILTDGIKRIVQLHSQECNGMYSIALLGNGVFCSISRDHKQPIKRSEFNKVLNKMLYKTAQHYIRLYETIRHYTDLVLPHPKREFLKNSFKFSGAKLWNSLPLQAKLAQSEYTFKMNINSLDT
jgi:hypothetical protein